MHTIVEKLNRGTVQTVACSGWGSLARQLYANLHRVRYAVRANNDQLAEDRAAFCELLSASFGAGPRMGLGQQALQVNVLGSACSEDPDVDTLDECRCDPDWVLCGIVDDWALHRRGRLFRLEYTDAEDGGFWLGHWFYVEGVAK